MLILEYVISEWVTQQHDLISYPEEDICDAEYPWVWCYDTLACFNLGNTARCKVLATLGIVPGMNCIRVL